MSEAWMDAAEDVLLRAGLGDVAAQETEEKLNEVFRGARRMVFCKLCRYYKRVDYEQRDVVECHAEGYEQRDWAWSWTVWEDPRRKNENNDCPDFVPTRLVKFTWWAKGVLSR